ncbi:MAG: glycerophosphoryl diester phosphodiesterase [Acidimicrobiaceae bacterium]|nr:glycerophosphoryl diester phosphodiesterase [Acidimicrobiaceae bacterium]
MTNPWLDRRVVAYAHQGGAKEAPSSTLYAIGKAIAAGATAIELDVHATTDGELVVCHDPTLDRTTSAAGPISERTLAEVAALDNAYWFVPGEDARHGRPAGAYPLRGDAERDPRLRVASLRSVLEGFPGVVLNLDIKRTAPQVEPYENLLADLLRSYDRTDDVIVASFHDRATDAFKAHAPEIATSAGRSAVTAFTLAHWTRRRPDAAITRHVALQVPARVLGKTIVDRRYVETAHRLGLAVHVWTIDDAGEMERLVRIGVDGVISDRPSVLGGVLARLDATWREAPGITGTRHRGAPN